MTTDNKQTRKKTGGSKKAPVRKKLTAKERAEQFRSLGVGLMLIGLLLGGWFLVLAVGVLLDKPTPGQVLADIAAGAANLALALTFVYLGYALYSERKRKFDSWQIAGWCFFLLAAAGLLHLGQFAGGFKAAMQAALAGFGGGVSGFVACLPVFWLPSAAARYIILTAFLLLGIMLSSDMPIFAFIKAIPGCFAGWFAGMGNDTDDEPKSSAASKRLAAKREMPQEVKLPPIITEYSGRRFEETPKSEYDHVTVGEMLSGGLNDGPEPAGVLRAKAADGEHMQEQKQTARAWGIPAETPAHTLEQAVQAAELARSQMEPPLPRPEAQVKPEAVESEPNESKELNVSNGTAEITGANEPVEGVHTELKRVVNYKLPPISLMKGGVTVKDSSINQRIMDDSQALENVLASFGVKTKVVEVICGPSIIRYELQPAPGVKISRIVGLADDIALALAARGLRIEAPVPGKSVVGIEVAREETSPVYFKDVLASDAFAKSKSKLSIAFGVDINGGAIVGDLAEMPHLLIAGATGSGKSVCMNTLICSILYKAKPDEVKFIMVDPKKVEMTGYVGLPHLGRPVVTDAKKASQVLKEVVNEMERRYLVFVNAGVKNFAAYNELPDAAKMPQIVVLIDELADLMMVASHDVEDSICRLAQMARAAGIHLVIATQRPSVDVITGLIKANIPSRIAFAVSSQIDSRTILDMGGAEKLLGKGDMLYFPIGRQKPLRVQGAFLSEDEIHDLVEYCKQQAEPEYLELPLPGEQEDAAAEEKDERDELFIDACQQVISSGQASASSLQRRFRIGYNRAARMVETMQELGIVSAPEGNRRTVLMNMPTFAELYLTPQEPQQTGEELDIENS